MSLADAEPLDGAPLPPLTGSGPFRCADLSAYAERKFILPAGHPDLLSIHDGGAATDPALDNLVGMRRWWCEHPDWRDFLSPDNPGHDDKLTERELYLDHWRDHLPAGARVMDLGGGIGRFTQWCLDHGCEVELVDPDLRSLWAAVKHAGGRPGRLDVHETGERLPAIAPVDVVIAAESSATSRSSGCRCGHQPLLKPGGMLLASVEARYALAMGPDVAEGSLDALFGDGIVHVDQDRWVRTFDEDDFRGLLADFGSVTLRRATMC